MSSDTLLSEIVTGILSAAGTAFVFVLTGGYKKQKQQTENELVSAIEKAGQYLATSNDRLRDDIKNMTTEYENKLNNLEKKFSFKEKEYMLRIENLELENKNLKLENANLVLENDRLVKDSGMRRLG